MKKQKTSESPKLEPTRHPSKTTPEVLKISTDPNETAKALTGKKEKN